MTLTHGLEWALNKNCIMLGYSRDVTLTEMMDYQIPKDSEKTSNWPDVEKKMKIKMLYESWEGELNATKSDRENIH